MDEDPPIPMCKALEAYAERIKNDPERTWDSAKGSLAKSLACGCGYCLLGCREMGKGDGMRKNKERNQDATSKNAGLPVYSRDSNRSIDITFTGRFEDSGLKFGLRSYDVSDREFFVKDRSDDPIIPVSTPISGFTGSREAFRTIGRWLEECVKTHNLLCPRLVSPEGPPRLPSRVVDVGVSDAKDVRLVETDHKGGYWACLSHCWGGEMPLVSTRESLSKHKEAIPWAELPATFKDAVIVARTLGIQYLWIDSLCILQDDRADWQVESARMAEIYHNSVLTIAGSASAGPHQGIFRHADASHIDHPIEDRPDSENLGKIRTRTQLTHIPHELPLLKRGWVHQERLLSPRVLHFTQNELIWECMQRLTCECQGLRPAGMIARPGSWLATKDMFHPYSMQLDDWKLRRGPEIWHTVIADYSRMGLTEQEDIFPAISGLAKYVRKTTGWEYVAGLWKENLIVDLVWMTDEPYFVCRRVPWRAPTFSWASIVSKSLMGDKSSINYRNMNYLRPGLAGGAVSQRRTYFYAQVLTATCTPINNGDMTGSLLSGYIVLRGTLIKATLYSTVPHHNWTITAVGKKPCSDNTIWLDFDVDCGPDQSTEVYCLRLIGSKYPLKNQFEQDEYLVYLVLKQNCETSAEASAAEVEVRTFERIGLLVNQRGEVQLEDESEASEIMHDTVVKIV